jgi:hypothetical protein
MRRHILVVAVMIVAMLVASSAMAYAKKSNNTTNNGMTASDAAGTVTSESHSWGGYHWARTANPFKLKLGDNLLSADWKSHLTQTSSDWNHADKYSTTTPVQPNIVAGTSNKRCALVAGTTQVCNGNYGNNG